MLKAHAITVSYTLAVQVPVIQEVEHQDDAQHAHPSRRYSTRIFDAAQAYYASLHSILRRSLPYVTGKHRKILHITSSIHSYP